MDPYLLNIFVELGENTGAEEGDTGATKVIQGDMTAVEG